MTGMTRAKLLNDIHDLFLEDKVAGRLGKFRSLLGDNDELGGDDVGTEVCLWLWGKWKAEENNLKVAEREREEDIKQVENYVEDIKSLADERDELVSQLQHDNRLIKNELISMRTPTELMSKWLSEESDSSLYDQPITSQFDHLLLRHSEVKFNYQKLTTLYQSEKTDSDLCRKRLEETIHSHAVLNQNFKKYKLEKETELEVLRSEKVNLDKEKKKELKSLRTECKNLQNQILSLQQSGEKENVRLQKTIKDLDEQNYQLKFHMHDHKLKAEQLQTSMDLRDEDMHRLRDQLTLSEAQLKEALASHTGDVTILHQTMENILSSRDSESANMLSKLENENAKLKQTIHEFQSDMRANKGHVSELEIKLAEAKKLCKGKTEETEKIQKILQEKITLIKDQLHNQEKKERDEIEQLKADKKRLAQEKESLKIEMSSSEKGLETKLDSCEDQMRTLHTQLELKDKSIQSLKAANRTLIDEITGFRQQHDELAASLSALKSGYNSDLTAHRGDTDNKARTLKEELDILKDQLRAKSHTIEDQNAEINKYKNLLEMEKQDNGMKIDKLSKQLAQKKDQIQQLINEKAADKEKFYDRIQQQSRLREDEEEGEDQHSLTSLSTKDSGHMPALTSSTPTRSSTRKYRNKSTRASIKDKNELVDMNKEGLLEHCLVLQFEMNELLQELDRESHKQDQEYSRTLQLKARCKEKLDKLKDQANKQKQGLADKLTESEHKVHAMKLEQDHHATLRNSNEQMLKRLNEDKRDLTAKLETAIEENKTLSRSLTSSERHLRDFKHENTMLQEKLTSSGDERSQLERTVREYEMKMLNGHSPNNTLTKSSGLGNSISYYH